MGYDIIKEKSIKNELEAKTMVEPEKKLRGARYEKYIYFFCGVVARMIPNCLHSLMAIFLKTSGQGIKSFPIPIFFSKISGVVFVPLEHNVALPLSEDILLEAPIFSL